MSTGYALGQAALAQQAYQLVISNRTPQEEWAIAEQKNQAILAKWPELETYVARERMKIRSQELNMQLDAASKLIGSFGQIFQALGAHNKKMFAIGKAFAIAEATI